jgi:DNA-binding transcriptional regulator YiaG
MVMFTQDKIVRLRELLGWSRVELAAYLKVTESTVFRWENGERHPNFPRQEMLNKLANENGIDLNGKVLAKSGK